MGKDSVNISAAATVLHEADKKVREHPSSADDKLTAERTSKHFCQYELCGGQACWKPVGKRVADIG